MVTVVIRTPHVHSQLIKQWAEGSPIQSFDGFKWHDDKEPFWSADVVYRLRPANPKYRVGMVKVLGCEQEVYPLIAYSRDEATKFEARSSFVRWDSDWKEYDGGN